MLLLVKDRLQSNHMAKQQKEDASRPLEAAHPYYSWSKCLELADAVYQSGGDRADVSKGMLAHALQMSEDSAALTQQISSAKTFGMIEGRGTYRLTDLGQRYFLPTTENESRLAELAFFRAPKAFAALIDRFDGNAIPSSGVLANLLLKNGNVPKSWKDRVAGIFLDAAAQLRVIDASGRLRYEVAVQAAARGSYIHPENFPTLVRRDRIASENAGSVPVGDAKSNEVHAKGKEPQAPFHISVPPESNAWIFSEAGGTLRVETPDPLPRALWLRLKRYVDMLEPITEEEGEEHGSTEKRGGE
jgi:hypothetical protein